MKKFAKIATLLFAFVACVLTACDQPEEEVIKNPLDDAAIKVSLVGTDKTSATVSLDVDVLKVVAYVVEPTDSKGEYTAEDILAGENLLTVETNEEGEVEPIQVTFNDLTPNTSYTVQVAGRINSKSVWSEVVKFEFVTEDRDPVLTAQLSKAEATSAEFVVTTDNISRFAYLLKKKEEGASTPKIPIIFATGSVVKSIAGDNTVSLTELSPNTNYAVYIAGEIAGKEEFFESVCTVEFTTTDFTDQIRVYDIDYRGFKVDLKVDPEVRAKNHVIRWGATDLVMFNNNYFGGLMNNAQGGATVASSIILNDKFYHNYVTESTTFIFNEDNGYIFDELGNYTGAAYYDAMVPGQPEVLMLGEYEWGDIEAVLGFSYGTPEQNLGYYLPLFNFTRYEYEWSRRKNTFDVVDEAAYWSGFFHKEIVQVQRPEALPEDALTLEIKTSPRDGEMYFTVTDDVELVSLMVLEDETYNTLMPYLNNNTDYLQWFATSMTGMYAVSSFTFNPRYDDYGYPVTGPRVVKLSEIFYDLYREKDYHVFAVGLSGDYNNDGYTDGYKQVYKTAKFQLPQATKPDPEIVITPNEEETTPYVVAYNVQSPTGDLEDAVYAVNTRKEWERSQYSIEEILESNEPYALYHLSGMDLIKINGDGAVITFQASPEEDLGLAIMGTNDEGSKCFAGPVYNKALEEPAPERVESPYFESLKGTWTATAYVLTADTVVDEETEEETTVYEKVARTCQVTVGDITYPETLSEEVYEIYKKVSEKNTREVVDAYYADLCAAIDRKNEKNRKFNRILMHGFNFEEEGVPYYQYQTPYDLFCSTTYNGSSSEAPATDFGPKWYLEIDAEGNVTAPFNVSTFDPMSNWYYDTQAIYESHLMAYYFNPEKYNPDENFLVGYLGDDTDKDGQIDRYVNGHFPVEISADGNTITVKPFIYSYKLEDGTEASYTCYPVSAINSGSGQFDALEICSEIVLTRNGTSAAAPALAPSKGNKGGKSISTTISSDVKINERTKTYSRSHFENVKPATKVTVKKYETRDEKAAAWHAVRKVK